MTYACRLDGEDALVELTVDSAAFFERKIPWIDIDRQEENGRNLVWHIASGLDPATTPVQISHLGKHHDECVDEIRKLRGAARRAACAHTPHEPLESFIGRRGEIVDDVIVLPQGISIEPRGGIATYLPWGLVDSLVRDGYSFTVRGHGVGDVNIAGFGRRTDEFSLVVARARTDLDEVVQQAFVDAGVPDVCAPDGWAVSAVGTGASILAAWAAKSRAMEVEVLLTVAEETRVGLWTEGGATALPFIMCRVGSRVAVEAVDADDRATFVFESDDLDRLNAALLLTSFRRELLSSDLEELGSWAVAVRTQPVVRWLRERLVARVVHNDSWPTAVLAALSAH